MTTTRPPASTPITAAGVAAAIGMALRLAAMEAGEDAGAAAGDRVRPRATGDSGSLETADAETQRRATEHMVPATEEAR